MKRTSRLLSLALLLAMAVAGCQEKPQEKEKQKVLDPGAMLYINVKTNPTMKAETDTKDPVEYPILTPREVVEQALIFRFTDPLSGKIDANLSIDDKQKDVENERIMMWGEMIINSLGSKDGSVYHLDDYFFKLRDLRIVGACKEEGVDNIVAYIPNARMEQAEIDIKQAYEAGNYDEVYRLFQELYTAIPINNDGWKALKEKGAQ